MFGIANLIQAYMAAAAEPDLSPAPIMKLARAVVLDMRLPDAAAADEDAVWAAAPTAAVLTPVPGTRGRATAAHVSDIRFWEVLEWRIEESAVVAVAHKAHTKNSASSSPNMNSFRIMCYFSAAI